MGRIKRKDKFVLCNTTASGYITVGLTVDNICKSYPVHQLVCKLFHGPAPQSGMIVNHINGIKNDNRAKNLEWATLSQNTLHAYATGLLVSKGHGKIKVAKMDQLGNILQEYESMNEAARLHKLSPYRIHDYCSQRTLDPNGFLWKKLR